MEFRDALKDTIIQAKKDRIPIIGLFELTARCNFNCKMCYVHETDAAYAKQNELSTETWKFIFDTLINKGMLHAVLSGGECLIRSDFCELYLYLFQKGIKVSVNTNGALIDKSFVNFFKTYKPLSLQISLYGCSEGGYLRVTERPGFQRVSNALSDLKEAKIPFTVQITPCKPLLDEFDDIIRFLLKNGYKYSIGEFLISNKDGDPLTDSNALTLDEYVSLLFRSSLLRNKLHEPPVSLPEPFGERTHSGGHGITCSAGTCRATIDWHGDLYSCYALNLPKYNVLDLDFDKAWELLGNDLNTVLQPAECSGCAYEKVCTICPAVRSEDLFSGHCDAKCCEYTRKLCSLGIRKIKK